MKTLICGEIDHDDVMSWCVENKKFFTEHDQLLLGRSWGVLCGLSQETIHTNNLHFFNGARLAVKEGKFDVNIIYIPSEENKRNILSGYLTGDGYVDIMITEKGSLHYWPCGMFDEAAKASLRILRS